MNVDELCPTLCECKTVKGRKLYDIYCSWVEDENLKSFDDLSHKEKVAWVMSANWKKKPPSEPPEDEQLNETVEQIIKEIKKDNKPKRNKKDITDKEIGEKQVKETRHKLQVIKKEKAKEHLCQLGELH